jgi:hypothetical protein
MAPSRARAYISLALVRAHRYITFVRFFIHSASEQTMASIYSKNFGVKYGSEIFLTDNFRRAVHKASQISESGYKVYAEHADGEILKILEKDGFRLVDLDAEG